MNTEICQPNLKSQSVTLRPLELGDFEPLFDVAKDPKIWDQHPAKNRCTRQGFKKFFMESIDSKGAIVIIDNISGKIIGSSRFNLIPNSSKDIEIGWTFISRSYWGTAYNRKVKELMIDHILAHFESVIFHVAKENIRSQKAVLKLGAIKIEGSSKRHLLKNEEVNFSYLLTIALCEHQ